MWSDFSLKDPTKKMLLHPRVNILDKTTEWVNTNTTSYMVRVEATEKHSKKVIDSTSNMLVYSLKADNGWCPTVSGAHKTAAASDRWKMKFD